MCFKYHVVLQDMLEMEAQMIHNLWMMFYIY
jgi:hypothetical protein